MSDLAGRLCVITGGARGIGRAIAARFLQEGGRVVIADIREDAAKRTAEELASLGKVDGVYVDVCDWAGVDHFFAQVAERWGKVDVCVNNAGVNEIRPSLEMTPDLWERVVAVNLSGVFACARAAATHMRERGGGAIVNMASAAGAVGLPGRAPYSAAKAGVISLTRVLGAEWAADGIRVNAIGPGWVKTDLVREAIETGSLSEESIRRRTPMDRLAEPAEIAELALFLASDRSSYFTGQTLYPDGGFTAAGMRP